MEYTKALEQCCKVNTCPMRESSPIPQEGSFSQVTEICDISGFSHSVGTCGLKQGACKMTLNVKSGIIEEALIEVIGCSGMTHSASMAAEILPGKTLLEALNTDLVCDAINVAMREFFLAMAYGRTQTAYSEGGLRIGAAMDDLGKTMRSQIGTAYGTKIKGPRTLETVEGYIKQLALDENDEVIGFEYINFGTFIDLVKGGMSGNEALVKATNKYGRYDDAVRYIDPRKE